MKWKRVNRVHVAGLIRFQVKEGDVNVVVASLMKLWIRELLDGIVPKEYFHLFSLAKEPSDWLSAFRKLPQTHAANLIFLLRFLKKLISYSAYNKMTCENVGIVFGPTLFKCPSEPSQMENYMNETLKAKEMMINLLENADCILQPSIKSSPSTDSITLEQKKIIQPRFKSSPSTESLPEATGPTVEQKKVIQALVKQTVSSFLGKENNGSVLMDRNSTVDRVNQGGNKNVSVEKSVIESKPKTRHLSMLSQSQNQHLIDEMKQKFESKSADNKPHSSSAFKVLDAQVPQFLSPRPSQVDESISYDNSPVKPSLASTGQSSPLKADLSFSDQSSPAKTLDSTVQSSPVNKNSSTGQNKNNDSIKETAGSRQGKVDREQQKFIKTAPSRPAPPPPLEATRQLGHNKSIATPTFSPISAMTDGKPSPVKHYSPALATPNLTSILATPHLYKSPGTPMAVLDYYEVEDDAAVSPGLERTLSPKPERTLSPKPERNLSPKPERNLSPKPERTLSPKPERALSPKPERALSPKPERN